MVTQIYSGNLTRLTSLRRERDALLAESSDPKFSKAPPWRRHYVSNRLQFYDHNIRQLELRLRRAAQFKAENQYV